MGSHCSTRAVGPSAPRIDKVRPFYNEPGFIEANIARLRAALEQIPSERRGKSHVAFTAHSIPRSMAENCDYEQQLLETSRIVAEAAGTPHWQLVFQSRSGPPTQPWLEPDIYGHLERLKEQAVADVVIAPIGFVSDHMEVVYDLDTEARKLCEELGLNMVRAATVGTHQAFISMIRDLILRKMNQAAVDVCAVGCCPKADEAQVSAGKPPFLSRS